MAKDNSTKLELIAQDVKYIQRDVVDIKSKMDADFITREEFEPIKRIVYGIITLLLTGLVAALLKLVLIK